MKDGCRTFSASVQPMRSMLGEHVTDFLARLRRAGGELHRYDVLQSSDAGYHCLSIVLWYAVPVEAAL